MRKKYRQLVKLLYLLLFISIGHVYGQASFTTSPASVNNTLTLCSGSQVLFTNTTAGNVNTINWIFPGGSPANANTTGPHIVTFANPGTYVVSLSVNGGAATTMQVIIQNSNPSPNVFDAPEKIATFLILFYFWER